MSFLVDIFLEQADGEALHFERKWAALPDKGDDVAVEHRDDSTGHTDLHVGVVTRRVFLSENEHTLRVQLTVTPHALVPTSVLLVGGEEAEPGDTL